MCHRVDTVEHTPADENAADNAEDHHNGHRPASGRRYDLEQPFSLFKIAPDQQAESARQLIDSRQRVVFVGGRFFKTAIRRFKPAGLVENAGGQRSDIAGQSLAGCCCDNIEA